MLKCGRLEAGFVPDKKQTLKHSKGILVRVDTNRNEGCCCMCLKTASSVDFNNFILIFSEIIRKKKEEEARIRSFSSSTTPLDSQERPVGSSVLTPEQHQLCHLRPSWSTPVHLERGSTPRLFHPIRTKVFRASIDEIHKTSSVVEL